MDFYRDFFTVPDDELRIFILLDGFGMNLFEKLGNETGNSWLVSHFIREMRSVYPSTTAVALTALASLREPGELGVTGWTTWLPEHQKLVNMLISRSPIKTYKEGEWDDDIVPQTLQVPSALGHEKVRLVQPLPYLPQQYAHWTSGGRRARIQGYNLSKSWNRREYPQHWRRVLRQAADEAQTGNLIYLYLPMIDSESHKSGWDSRKTFATLQAIEEDLAGLAQDLATAEKRCTIALTADHGLINIPQKRHYHVDDSTPWMQYLESSISGEGRNPIFHIIPGQEEAFRRSFTGSTEGGSYELFTPEQLVEQGHFGDVGISVQARPRWGSLIGLARNDAYIQDRTKGQTPPNFIGHHGGTDAAERRVPLISLKM